MLVFDTQDEIVGWFDQTIDPRSDRYVVEMFQPEPEPWARTSPFSSISASVRTAAVQIASRRYGFAVDPMKIQSMGLETTQFHRGGATLENTRLIASRICKPGSPVLIALDAPRHTTVSLAHNEMTMDFTFNVSIRALCPSVEQAEMLFDMNEFMPIDQSRYALGDMPMERGRPPLPGKTSFSGISGAAIGGPVSNSNAIDWMQTSKLGLYSGLTIKRPESHIRVTGIT